MKMEKLRVGKMKASGIKPSFKARRIVSKLKTGYILSKRAPSGEFPGYGPGYSKETMMFFGAGAPPQVTSRRRRA